MPLILVELSPTMFPFAVILPVTVKVSLIETASKVVAPSTSNPPPTGLYNNGLHRVRILPFIESLKLKTEIIEIQNGDDWRERSLSGNKVWLSPINKENKKKIDNIFLKLSLGFVKQSETIEISGRTIFIPQVAAGIAKIDFDDLCNKPLAASDYIEIGQRYKGIIIENIPVLDDKSRNETRRFIWLIDALYDNCLLYTSPSPRDED